ncbi:MAG TPA: PCYCGC motif-containing (lipo)protein [Longimicrobium sp.]|nr:PCYCGC motif-containing (lipo)protein [Longimicrobium sp.]
MRPFSRSAHRSPRLPMLMAAALLCALVPAGAGAQEHAHHHGGSAAGAPAAQKHRHPAPRQGITAERVLPPERVPERAREVYAMAAQIPRVLDGIYCHCDCHARDGLRSLLECFENEMAGTCGICQAQARLVHELHEAGKRLNQIRKAVDAEYGPGG